MLGSAWTVYTNVFRADVYPTLDSANFDAPLVKRSPAVAAREPQTVVSDAFAALREQAPPVAKSIALAPASTLSFDDRFAAAAPEGVEPAPQPEKSRVAEAPKPSSETPKFADAGKAKRETPKLAEAPKPKAPVQVAALPPQRPAETPGGEIAGIGGSRHGAACQGRGDVARLERETFDHRKAVGQGTLAWFAAGLRLRRRQRHRKSRTGTGRSQNPALGGSAPYDRSTAVYDISAHTVYLPDGSKLEAHSGLGSELDDPSSARIRMRGVTPPHIYELKPREALFHGVPALRLNPIGGEEAIYGRSGLLAHTYMLGPNGDSNGCVSFKDYNAFLNAYRNQGIKRLAVVARVE